MKILIVRNSPDYMDIVHNTYNIQEIGLAKAFVRQDHECDVVFWTKEGEKYIDFTFDEQYHIKVYYRKGINFLKNGLYLIPKKMVEQYDIVQLSEYNQLQSWLFAIKYPQKTVVFHGPYYSEFNKKYNALCKLMDWFLIPVYKKRGTKFIVKSNLAKQFLQSKGIAPNNISVSGVGIDKDSFLQKVSNTTKEYKEIEKLSGELKLLYIGRIEPRRNPAFLIQVLEKLRNNDVNANLIIVGTGDLKYCNQILEFVKERNLLPYVAWIPKMEQKYLPYIYKCADIFLLPTSYEIFGMVLLEAMYFGKPVITTQNGGSDILIDSDVNGVVIPKLDVDAWVEKIIEIQGDTAMGKRAHEVIDKQYTWDTLVTKFVEVYREIVSDCYS
jgi:glycosyltransferase involved in cell wall biosynthesis